MIRNRDIILTFIFILLLITGCTPKVSPNFKDMIIEVEPTIEAQDKDGYSIKVVIKNESKSYKFIPSPAFIRIYKGSPSHQELTTVPYLIEAFSSTEGDPNTFVYNIYLPIQFLDVEPGVDKESVDVVARGIWLSSTDKYIGSAEDSVQLYLNRN